VRPEARDTAREAARRAGIPVGQWLDQAILDRAGPGPMPPYYQHHQPPHRQHQQHHAPYPPQPHYAPRPAASAYPQQQPAYAPDLLYPAVPAQPVYAPPPQPDWAGDLERAVAEISARQHSLDADPGTPPQSQRPPVAAPTYPPAPPPAFNPSPPIAASAYMPPPHHAAAPQSPPPDLSGLERQLHGITSQIEKLNSSNGFAKAIAELRQDLAEIGRTLTEALPRRALEALEAEVRNLAGRIEQSRMAGVDPAAIANMERGLADIRDALRALAPAENLVGFESALRDLSGKIDQLAVTQHDPAALQQLEATISALRGLVSHVASNDTLTGLSEEMRSLAAKVERTTHAAASFGPDALSSLEKRIGDLPVLGAIERGFTELRLRIEELQAPRATMAPEADAVVGHLRHDLGRTQNALENVQGTLSLVVDRLAHLESSIQGLNRRETPAAPAERATPHVLQSPQTPPAQPAPLPPQPAATVLAAPAAAPAAIPPATQKPPAIQTPVAASAPSAGPAPSSAPAPQREKPKAMPPAAQERPPINPNLPPDFPLEPGTGAPHLRPKASAAERIAASEAALAPGKAALPDAAPTNFIAAARRAAQAAAPAASATPAQTKEMGKSARTLGQRVRALIVGGSAVLVIGAAAHVGLKILDPANRGGIDLVLTDPPAGFEEKMLAEEEAEERAQAEAARAVIPTTIAPAGHSATGAPPAGVLMPESKPLAAAQTQSPAAAEPTVTGSVAPRPAATKPAANTEPQPALPDKLPTPLREAALNGDAAAEYEVGIRYLEGRGVAQSSTEALRWLERAAAAGLAPAQFRLGGLHEKGQGVKKNLDTARALYQSAAEKGNAKAMHNLAVLYAEGIDGKPDYKSAAGWFRKAAEYGTTDSQHNLGILYARGVGVEQNLAESYKWFSLAANQGDRDSASKRDEVASRLDQGSLMAAKLAVQTFVAKTQPDEAVNARTPAGGWDRPAGTARPQAPQKKQKSGTPTRITPS
jgi:localization factor PodJL